MITSQTEKRVCDAFIDLMETKRYDEIKTKDLITKAGIARSTFYDHFDSPLAVLEKIETDLFNTFPDGVSVGSDTTSSESIRKTAARLACRHLQKNAKTYRALCGPNGDYAFQTLMEKRNRQIMAAYLERTSSSLSANEKQIAVQAMAGAQWYVLKWWAFHTDEVSVTELANMLFKIQSAICSVGSN